MYELAESVFKEMDENEDGKISQEEFIKACLGKKKFSTMIALKIIKIFIESLPSVVHITQGRRNLYKFGGPVIKEPHLIVLGVEL